MRSTPAKTIYSLHYITQIRGNYHTFSTLQSNKTSLNNKSSNLITAELSYENSPDVPLFPYRNKF